MVEKQSLADYGAQASRPWKKRCSVCDFPDGVREQVDAHLGRLYATVIADWLQEHHEIEIAPQTLNRHRRKCLS